MEVNLIILPFKVGDVVQVLPHVEQIGGNIGTIIGRDARSYAVEFIAGPAGMRAQGIPENMLRLIGRAAFIREASGWREVTDAGLVKPS